MGVQTKGDKLDELMSRMEIHDLAMAYCRGVDRADAELLKTIFHEESTVISGVIDGSGTEFAEGITSFVRENLDYCFHAIANEWIKIDGDQAAGELYVLAHMTAGGQDVMTGGRYLDKYERRDGTWKIKSRTFVVDWNRTNPSTLNLDGMANRGCWGRDDPVFALWD